MKPSQIGVISPYAAQIEVDIKKKFTKNKVNESRDAFFIKGSPQKKTGYFMTLCQRVGR